jgi:hypothetical protein
MKQTFISFEETTLGDPVPRAQAAADAIKAATSEYERCLEGYRVGATSVQQCNKAEKKLRDAHWRAYTVESGRIDDFRNE